MANLETDIIGTYTSFYRARTESEGVSSEEADRENMKILGINKYNPLNIFRKVINYLLR